MSKLKPDTGTKEVKIAMAAEKVVPRFCNSINFGKVNNNVIMTLIFNEPDNSGVGMVIERVVIDADHAQKVMNILGKLLKK